MTECYSIHAAIALRSAVVGLLILCVAVSAEGAGLWSVPEMVRPNDGYDSIFPNVEVSSDGTVWIVWSGEDPVQHDSETYYVRVRDFIPSDRYKIHEDNLIMDRCPIMSMGSDGVPWVVWERYNSTLGYIQVVTHWTDEGWAPADTVLTLGDRWDEYTIEASSSDDVWVARSSRSAGRSDRDLYVRHWNGSAWGDIEAVGFVDHEDISPQMTVDDAGRAWLAWVRCNAVTGRHYVCASSYGDVGWSEPAEVDTTPGNLKVGDISVCPDGRLIIAWAGSGYTTAGDIEFATSRGDTWSYGGLVNDPDDPWVNGDGSCTLARGPNGTLWAIWTSLDVGETRTAITASRWLGNDWGEEEMVSAADTASLQDDHLPDIAMAPDGRIWAVWERQAEDSPYDLDIYRSYRDLTTAVDVWELRAEVQSSSVAVSWQASSDAAQDGFRVWRSEGCAEQAGSIPSDAVCLTDVAIRDCMSCGFTDSAVPGPGTYCYWLKGGGGDTFGPVTVDVSPQLATAGLTVFPNPTGNGAVFHVSDLRAAGVIRIHTVGGRVVRTLELPPLADGSGDRMVAVAWDGTDDSGQRLPCGVYYAELRQDGSEEKAGRARVVILR